MKKFVKFYVHLLFLSGILLFIGCERDDIEITPVNEVATDESLQKCGQVSEPKLKHVMLFEFNDNTSHATIGGFIKALCAFKDSIKEVKDIEWGKNLNYSGQSPFTYCFIVTFNSMDDFLLYLNNPFHSNFIIKWLNPNIKDVIAFDYMSTDIKNSYTFNHKLIRELVLFNYKDNLMTSEIDKVVDSFTSLARKIRAIQKFEWGSELQLLGLNKDYNDGFLLTFKNIIEYNCYSNNLSVKYFFQKVAIPSTDAVLKVYFYKER